MRNPTKNMAGWQDVAGCFQTFLVCVRRKKIFESIKIFHTHISLRNMLPHLAILPFRAENQTNNWKGILLSTDSPFNIR